MNATSISYNAWRHRDPPCFHHKGFSSVPDRSCSMHNLWSRNIRQTMSLTRCDGCTHGCLFHVYYIHRQNRWGVQFYYQKWHAVRRVQPSSSSYAFASDTFVPRLLYIPFIRAELWAKLFWAMECGEVSGEGLSSPHLCPCFDVEARPPSHLMCK